MSEPCSFCGQQRAHYLTHICADCECHHTEVRIPGEPHIPSYYEAEMNPDCPVHGDTTNTPADPGADECAADGAGEFERDLREYGVEL